MPGVAAASLCGWLAASDGWPSWPGRPAVGTGMRGNLSAPGGLSDWCCVLRSAPRRTSGWAKSGAAGTGAAVRGAADAGVCTWACVWADVWAVTDGLGTATGSKSAEMLRGSAAITSI
ncbi:hypothetical protein AAV32_11415 [Kerstersia gyiorum]|uniref:Uncharacterized protein n=1 Tax=Kerstersia gyiorum TaxID=206506 RepID=A0A171KRD0_9BURK|nr:hypothetical protein AAV32_11415 [Kerstersia gyiorum]